MADPLITRQQAEAMIGKQMKESADIKKLPRHLKPEEFHGGCVHYGKCEQRDLLDAIYGPKETSDENAK